MYLQTLKEDRGVLDLRNIGTPQQWICNICLFRFCFLFEQLQNTHSPLWTLTFWRKKNRKTEEAIILLLFNVIKYHSFFPIWKFSFETDAAQRHLYVLQGSHSMKLFGILRGAQMWLTTTLDLHQQSVENTYSFPMPTLHTQEENLWVW